MRPSFVCHPEEAVPTKGAKPTSRRRSRTRGATAGDQRSPLRAGDGSRRISREGLRPHGRGRSVSARGGKHNAPRTGGGAKVAPSGGGRQERGGYPQSRRLRARIGSLFEGAAPVRTLGLRESNPRHTQDPQRGRPGHRGFVPSGGGEHHILFAASGAGRGSAKGLKKAGFSRKKTLDPGKTLCYNPFYLSDERFLFARFFPRAQGPRRPNREAMPADSG